MFSNNPQERQAFLKPYSQFPRFSDANGGLLLDEFIDAQEVVSDLSAEYEACEHADYVSGLRPLKHMRPFCSGEQQCLFDAGWGLSRVKCKGHSITKKLE